MAGDFSPAEIARIAEHLMAAKMFSLASCVMLFYDICLTFGDEVERIWKQKFTGATALWFLNRYLPPLGFIVVIVSFHDPWSQTVCSRYILYPEVLKLFTSFAVGCIFVLRLYAIYALNKFVLISMSFLLAAEMGVKIWAFTDGTWLELPPGLVGCILVGKSASWKRFVCTWIAELVFDYIVFLATLFRTIALYRQNRYVTLTIINFIMRDGVMYFAVIFGANLVTVSTFLFAPAELKAVNASFSNLITSLMVSRLMLNLRAAVGRGDRRQFSSTSGYEYRSDDFARFGSLIGNLGQPIDFNTNREDCHPDITNGHIYRVEFDPEGMTTDDESETTAVVRSSQERLLRPLAQAQTTDKVGFWVEVSSQEGFWVDVELQDEEALSPDIAVPMDHRWPHRRSLRPLPKLPTIEVERRLGIIPSSFGVVETARAGHVGQAYMPLSAGSSNWEPPPDWYSPPPSAAIRSPLSPGFINNTIPLRNRHSMDDFPRSPTSSESVTSPRSPMPLKRNPRVNKLNPNSQGGSLIRAKSFEFGSFI